MDVIKTLPTGVRHRLTQRENQNCRLKRKKLDSFKSNFRQPTEQELGFLFKNIAFLIKCIGNF
jgi:hypothetical protein